MKKKKPSPPQAAYSGRSAASARKHPKMLFPGDKGFRYLDDEERELIEELESAELAPVPHQAEKVRKAQVAARDYFKRKDARVNLRLSNGDLYLLKKRAESEGMPYQTLIASVLHKFVTGQLS